MSSADPTIRVFTTWYEDLRNNHIVLAHSGVFFFNFINILCILIFHGFVLRRLSKNFLMKMALLACIGQLSSSLCSIHRYNINDEFGYWGHVSIATGLVAYTFFNIVMMHVFLNINRKGSIGCIPYMVIGVIIWIEIAVGCWFIGRARWEVDNFKYFRIFVSLSTAFQFVSYCRFLWAFSKGMIGLDKDFPVSKETVIRLFRACIALILLSIGCAFTGCPVFEYPATGCTFSVMVAVVSLVGEMDFMYETPNGTSDEGDLDAPASANPV